MGFCATPLMLVGAGTPAASSSVGMMSITEQNCVRRPPLSLMRAGHEMTMPLRVPPKCEAICLRPLERRIHRVRPADRIVIERRRAAQLIHPADDFLHVLGDGVEHRHLVEQSLHAAFGARAVIALDVDDERVVQFALRFDGVEDAAHLVVGVRERRA